MAQRLALAGSFAGTAQPAVRNIGFDDIKDAIALGFADFKRTPTHLMFLFLIYPIVTVVFARVAAGYDMLPVVFPLLAGYTLIGPLVATGTYELSRRHELGLDSSRRHMLDVLVSPHVRAIAGLGLILMVIYFAWLGAALTIYDEIFGGVDPASIPDYIRQVTTTPAGIELMIVGTGAGAIFAAVVFSLSVVSFPMLLDRDVSILTAVTTSIRVVLVNPVMMTIWAFVVAGSLLIGALPLFVGLAIVLPVLGHATWHLYRKVVER
jgi:uncharacterized membrane protein